MPASAISELHQAYLPTSSDLLPNDALQELIGFYQKDGFNKAIQSPFPVGSAAKTNQPGMRSVHVDKLNTSYYLERPSSITFDGLRNIVAQTPVLNAVIMTRVRQIQRFCRLSESDTSLPGFEIRHVNRMHQATKSELEKMAMLGKFISHCGFEPNARKRKELGRDTFAQFMGKVARDSLILDAVSIETEQRNDKTLGMAGFYAVDGATIRLCPDTGYSGDPDIYAVQVVSGVVRTLYQQEDLVYEPRN